MNFYTARVPLTSQRPRHYTRATRKLYVARRQVISIVGVHRGGLMQSSRSAVRRIHANNVETKARTKRRSGLTCLRDRKQATRRYVRPQRAPVVSDPWPSRVVKLKERIPATPRRRAEIKQRGSRCVAAPREPDGGTKPLGERNLGEKSSLRTERERETRRGREMQKDWRKKIRRDVTGTGL